MAYRKFNNNNRDQKYGEKPVKEGESYDITIEGVGSKGDGIGKIQGFVLIVPGAKAGDNVKVKVTAVRGKVAFAEVIGQGTPKEQASEETGNSEENTESDSEETEASDSEDSEEELEETIDEE